MIKISIKKYLFLFILGVFSLFGAKSPNELISGCIRRLEPVIDEFLDNSSNSYDSLDNLWKTGFFVDDLIAYSKFDPNIKSSKKYDFDEKLKKFFPLALSLDKFSRDTTPERLNYARKIGKLIESNKFFSKFINDDTVLKLMTNLNVDISRIINFTHVQERHVCSPLSSKCFNFDNVVVLSPSGVSGAVMQYKKNKLSITEFKSVFPTYFDDNALFKLIEQASDYSNYPEAFDLIFSSQGSTNKHLVYYKPKDFYIELLMGGNFVVRTAYPVMHYEDISNKPLSYTVDLDLHFLQGDLGRYNLPITKSNILDYFFRNQDFEVIYSDPNNSALVVVDILPPIEEKYPDFAGKIPRVYVKLDKTQLQPRHSHLITPQRRKLNARADNSPTFSSSKRLESDTSAQDAGPSNLSLASVLIDKKD